MRELILNEKTGLKIMDISKPVIIRDSRGKMFYSTEPLIPRATEFNLPGGFRFFVDQGYFRKMDVPVRYGRIKLPRPERVKPQNPMNFDIVFMDNPKKVTVDWDQRVLIFDNDFKEKPIPELYWAFFHECGHKYWNNGEKAEMTCDEYAVNCMLKYGFNPHQCGLSILHALDSDSSIRRKENLIRKIVKL